MPAGTEAVSHWQPMAKGLRAAKSLPGSRFNLARCKLMHRPLGCRAAILALSAFGREQRQANQANRAQAGARQKGAPRAGDVPQATRQDASGEHRTTGDEVEHTKRSASQCGGRVI